MQNLQTAEGRKFTPRGPRGAADAAAAVDRLLGKHRLIVISNREPYVRRRGADGELRYERTAGGLVTALDPLMRSSGGVWVAWQPDAEKSRETRLQVPDEEPRFTLRQVPISRREVAGYYYGFANRALWPLCHYFIDRCCFEQADWKQYLRINRRFADAVVEEARSGDLVWVQDYHFCLLPQMIRERRHGSDDPLAFFLHIPFPHEEVFRILPWRRQVLAGLLGADLVGFHCSEYAEHFLGCCQRLLGTEVDHRRGVVHWQGRQVRAGAFPIGIDNAEFAAQASEPAIVERAARLRQKLDVEHVILGVDRLDYSKGILQRLYAMDVLLEAHPELRRRVVLLQVAVPSRTQVKEYGDLKREIDEAVGRINGRHGTPLWQPIRYLYRGVPRQELVALYRMADVCLVTPLRDGMNLVALEFAACQPEGSPGVLVLSELTGAATQLGNAPVVVNPFAVHEMADALADVLAMPIEERRRRMSELQHRVDELEIHGWLERMLEATLGVGGVVEHRAG